MTTTETRARRLGTCAALLSGFSMQAGAATAMVAEALSGLGLVALARQVVPLCVLIVLQPRRWRWIGSRGLGIAAVAGILSTLMTATFYGASRIQGLALTSLIDLLGPLALALLGMRWQALLIAGPLLGCGLLLATGVTSMEAHPAGIALALVSAGSWLGLILLNHRLCRYPRVAHAFDLSAVAGCLSAGMIAFLLPTEEIDSQGALLLALVGILAGALPRLLDIFALSRILPDRYGLLMLLHPLWALGFDEVLGQQRADGTQLVGVGVTLITAAFILRAPQRRPGS